MEKFVYFLIWIKFIPVIKNKEDGGWRLNIFNIQHLLLMLAILIANGFYIVMVLCQVLSQKLSNYSLCLTTTFADGKFRLLLVYYLNGMGLVKRWTHLNGMYLVKIFLRTTWYVFSKRILRIYMYLYSKKIDVS